MNKNQEEFKKEFYQFIGVTIMLIFQVAGAIGGIMYLWNTLF